MAGGTSDTSVWGEMSPPSSGGSLAGHREAEGAGAAEQSPGQQLPGCSWFSAVLQKTFSLSVPPFFYLHAKLPLSKMLFGTIQCVSQD